MYKSSLRKWNSFSPILLMRIEFWSGMGFPNNFQKEFSILVHCVANKRPPFSLQQQTLLSSQVLHRPWLFYASAKLRPLLYKVNNIDNISKYYPLFVKSTQIFLTIL